MGNIRKTDSKKRILKAFIEILNTNLGERELIFKGMIKNKSELRKLLKQLNIL